MVDRVANPADELPAGVSVVVPVYQSVDSLSVLVSRVRAVLGEQVEYEIVMVDDGSAPRTWATVQQLSTEHPEVVGVRLSRNYGQHNALVAGLRQARFATCVTIDDDLQNPPEEIPLLLAHLDAEGLDVVYGVPDQVEQTLWRRLSGRISRRAMRTVLGMTSAPDVSSFRAFHTRLRDAFSGPLGTNVSLDALLSWGTTRFGSVPVSHDPRTEGTSNYTFSSLLRFAVDTTTGYSAVPLQIASITGLVTAVFGVVVLLWVVLRPLLTGESVPGFPFLASTIAIFSGVQLFTLGIIGEYLARMHFRVMSKPTYVVAETTADIASEQG